ncbi:MAG: lipid II:glycine glycyltransferase FemX [Candidatus Dormibacteria bacterium]
MARGAPADWDATLMPWRRANLLQARAWGQVQSRAGWRSHWLQVPTRLGVLPVLALSGPGGLPGFSRLYVPRGPVCEPDDLESFAAVELALRELGTRCRALALEVEPAWEEREVPPGHPWGSWAAAAARQPLATVVVDLGDEPERILQGFSAKTRYNVRLAERRGVEVDERAQLSDLVHCLNATEARKGIHLPSPAHLGTVVAELGADCRILAARVEGEVVAAILVAGFAGAAAYLYGGSTGKHRERMPNHLLHWRAVLRAREEGRSEYDLWGVPENDDPAHPWRGLAQFKRGFAGHERRYAGARLLQLLPAGATIVGLVDAARRRARHRGRR